MYESKLLRDSAHHTSSAVRVQFGGHHVPGLDDSSDDEEDEADDDEGADGAGGSGSPQRPYQAGTTAARDAAGRHTGARHGKHKQRHGAAVATDSTPVATTAATGRTTPHPPPDPRAATATSRRASFKDARVKFAASPADAADAGDGDGGGGGSSGNGGRSNSYSSGHSLPLQVPMQAQVRLATSHGPPPALHCGSGNSVADSMAKAAAAAGAAYAPTAPGRLPWPTNVDIKERLGWQASSQVLGASRRTRRASTTEVGVFKDPVLAELAAAAAVAEAAQGDALPDWATRTVTLTTGQETRVRLDRARLLHLLHNGAEPAAFVAAAAGLSGAAGAAAAAEAATAAEMEAAEAVAVLATEAEAVAVACGADDGTSSASPTSSGRLLQVTGARLQSLRRRSFGALPHLPSIGGSGSSSNLSFTMAAAASAVAAADGDVRPPTALNAACSARPCTSQSNLRLSTGASPSTPTVAPSGLSFRSSMRSAGGGGGGGGGAVAAAINAAYGGGCGGGGADDPDDSAGGFGSATGAGAPLRGVDRAAAAGQSAAAAPFQPRQTGSPHRRSQAGPNSAGVASGDGAASPFGTVAAAADGDGYGGVGQAPMLPRLGRAAGGAGKARRASLDEAWLAAQAAAVAGAGGAQAISRWAAQAAAEARESNGGGADGGIGRAPPRSRHSLLQLNLASSSSVGAALSPSARNGISPSAASYTSGSGTVSRDLVREAMRPTTSTYSYSPGGLGGPAAGLGGGGGSGGSAFGMPDRRAVSHGGPSPQQQHQQPASLLSPTRGAGVNCGDVGDATGTSSPSSGRIPGVPQSFRQSQESSASEGGSGHGLVSSLMRALRPKK
ncbi:hypothetical protein HXX76_000126 [Chlamydomonas incerta]|uniref:Uncharacterized protein n=1 Tax=Chlamydomonas incerta TaxID=51695 RepID=A0A835WDM8_CHLIN|nr:hypothetical protein HXX76_000126 [Chlamydomonas incerta]|eukprot:KAG2445510.1 hypothetical protein HXX76_000126 [Chlamydomonas incerta]